MKGASAMETINPAQAIVERCQQLFDDLDFNAVKQWKAAVPGRKAIGYMPVYVPRELVHAAGMLPVGILGGGDAMEVIQGDAYYQSYICRIPRSTLELGLTGKLDCLDGMLFPSICDVIRNLSGMWQILFKDKYVKYFDVPQNYVDEVGGSFYIHEMQALREDLGKIRGAPITDAEINDSIRVYNDNRAAIRELYAYRAVKPWQAPTSEVYLVLRAGMVLPPEEHTALVREYLAATDRVPRARRDNARVVVNGSFCEQPPLALIKSIEMAGCYVVDDDFMLVTRWLLDEVPADADPLQELSKAFLHRSASTAAKYDATRQEKGMFLLKQVKTRGAEGVIFAAPSFCDPALLERPMLQDVLAQHKVPYTAFKYAENTGQMAPIREQAGTFADSIKLWSDAAGPAGPAAGAPNTAPSAEVS
jgi:benzoyl-CoA reductase subunit C